MKISVCNSTLRLAALAEFYQILHENEQRHFAWPDFNY